MTVSDPGVLVLGVGNVLWADEGLGVRCVEELERRYTFPDGVTLMDGGTQGMYLVNDVCAASKLLILDAVDFGDPPGTLQRVTGEDVPRFTGAKKMSMHQTGMQDVLSTATLMGKVPAQVVLIGVQPKVMEDFGGSLTPEVDARVEDVLRLAVEQLTAWGVPPVPRAVPAPSPIGPGLDRASYESQRPTEQDVWRHGDARFLPVDKD